MSVFWEWFWPVLTAAGFTLIGAGLHLLVARLRTGGAQRGAAEILQAAQRDAEVIRKEAQLAGRDEMLRKREQAESGLQQRQLVLSAAADRLSRQDERLEREEQRLEERAQALDVRAQQLETARATLTTEQEKLTAVMAALRQRLEAAANLSAAQARAELLASLQAEISSESADWLRQAQADAQATATQEARRLLLDVLPRVAVDHISDITTVAVRLPDESMKGRIIGREGRNIRALELATGVSVIIDDSPEVVVLSSFDPIRREVAKVALERLVADGRINPALIEETVDRVAAEVDGLILQAGQDALTELQLAPAAAEVAQALGRLKFRTSYAQNLLQHARETAHVAGLLAAELGLNVAIAKRAGLFHDLGKAATQEAGGPHAEIGADLLQRAGESAEVVAAVRTHHVETAQANVYAALVAVADAVTAARPGARSDTTEPFLLRLKNLEEIAAAEPGVVRSLAMQAGRELRIFVEPTAVDDAAAIQLARRIAQEIEARVDHPGPIKVTVIRELRCVEYVR